jgi:soluble lytic murein transglycosylase
MSSMVRATGIVLLLATSLLSPSAHAQDGSEWDRARAQGASSQRGNMGMAIERWKLLSTSDRMSFTDYSGFLLSYPGFPDEDKIRGYAEQALDRESVDPTRVIAFFTRYPPLSNSARANHAVALIAARRPEAPTVALAAWRGGPMSETAYPTIFSNTAGRITPADHDARMDALLWAGHIPQAQRQIVYVSPARRQDFMARLGMLNGQDPSALGLNSSGDALRDPGYVYNRVRQLRRAGSGSTAANLLATRPTASKPVLEPERWVTELLSVARGTDGRTAARIAGTIDDAFPAGTDVSRLSFKLRDDYTSLMWLGGTSAMRLGDYRTAAPLFYRYGTGARTGYTRAKGFYWAGRAMSQAGDSGAARRYFELAAATPDNFHGLLALERLGRPVPRFNDSPVANVTPQQRAAFNAQPLTAAVREVAHDYQWRTSIRFFRQIADNADTEADHKLVADLAREIGRRDLGVILGQSAHSDGHMNFHAIAFPLIPNPPGTNWTAVHAISRQESQFAMNALSHAGASGLMQLMPGTAREQAGKMGMSYQPSSLMTDANYNIRLGDGYFARMLSYFGGSYPLAIAAYNAGPGNVNKFIRQNGDPRNGSIDWIDWIERIPLSETRNYVQRVLENVVVYEAMHPEKARYRGSNPTSYYLGKRTPG